MFALNRHKTDEPEAKTIDVVEKQISGHAADFSGRQFPTKPELHLAEQATNLCY